MNFLRWRHVLRISERLLSNFEELNFRISIFSAVHRWHLPISGLKDLICFRMENLVFGFFCSFFNFQMYVLRVVDCLESGLLLDDLWFLYLTLNVVAASPM